MPSNVLHTYLTEMRPLESWSKANKIHFGRLEQSAAHSDTSEADHLIRFYRLELAMEQLLEVTVCMNFRLA